MDRNPTSVACPDCAGDLSVASFVLWGAQTALWTTTCARCGSPVTFASSEDGVIDVTGAPIGRGVHGTTREERARETLVSRPHVGQRD